MTYKLIIHRPGIVFFQKLEKQLEIFRYVSVNYKVIGFVGIVYFLCLYLCNCNGVLVKTYSRLKTNSTTGKHAMLNEFRIGFLDWKNVEPLFAMTRYNLKSGRIKSNGWFTRGKMHSWIVISYMTRGNKWYLTKILGEIAMSYST